MKTRRWDFISAHRAEFGVQRLCRVLGTSRSGYYKHLATEPARVERQAEEAAAVAEIRAIHAEHRSAYGAPRVHAELRSRGRKINRKRVTEAGANPPRGRPAPASQQAHDYRGQVGSVGAGSGDARLHRYGCRYQMVWGHHLMGESDQRSDTHKATGGRSLRYYRSRRSLSSELLEGDHCCDGNRLCERSECRR